MNIPSPFQIKTVAAYQTGDGEKFHHLEEARTHTRRHLLGMIFDAQKKERPDYARLDRELFIDLCMTVGPKIGATMNDALEPQPISGTGPAFNAFPGASPIPSAQREVSGVRPVTMVPRSGATEADAAIAKRFAPRPAEVEVDLEALAKEL